MPPEALNKIFNFAKPIGITLGIYLLLNSAFSSETRKSIRKRSDGKSEISGLEGVLEASHLNHSRDYEGYNDPLNGVSMLLLEHMLYHLSFCEFPEIIGLCKRDNICAITGLDQRIYAELEKSTPIFDELPKISKSQLQNMFDLLTTRVEEITKERNLPNPYWKLAEKLDSDPEFSLVDYLVDQTLSQENLRLF